MGAYKGPESTIKDAEKKEDSFKKGGKVKKKNGGAMKKDLGKCSGGKAAMRADRPARKSGGAVFSSASSGTPSGKASHY